MEKDMIEKEKSTLFSLIRLEDLAEKKAMIYARLLTNPALAQGMEELAEKHAKRKNRLLRLATGKEVKEDEDEA